MLTQKMIKTLEYVSYGVRLYSDGYFCVDMPNKKVDGRSLEALKRRGLISWQGFGGSTYQIHITLTELGEKTIKEARTSKV